MRTAVSGSIATDHLMVFPGRFEEQPHERVPGPDLAVLLADRLEVREGGVGANIAFGLGRLGLRPVLVGAAGADFADYRARLERAGVDMESSASARPMHTARFVCTTDLDQNQIATFYAGAMTEAARIDLAETHARVGGPRPAPGRRRRSRRRCCGTPTWPTASASRSPPTPPSGWPGSPGNKPAAWWTVLSCSSATRYESALLVERTGWSD